MNLRDQLDSIAGPAPATTGAQLDADLTRGRSALRRRRTFQAVGGGAFAVAAVAAAMSFTLTGTASTSGTTAAGPAATSTSTSTGVKLVAFTGTQPKGFTIDKVPAGFFIQSDQEGFLLLAPEKAKNQPDVNPSTNPLVDPQSFVGKIAIMLQSKDASVPTDGTKVDVAGKQGILFQHEPAQYPKGQAPAWAEDEKPGKTLWVQQQDGPWVNVQFDGSIGLTEAQMIEIGAGVEVHEGAVQGVG